MANEERDRPADDDSIIRPLEEVGREGQEDDEFVDDDDELDDEESDDELDDSETPL